jgi:hypothetical protein
VISDPKRRSRWREEKNSATLDDLLRADLEASSWLSLRSLGLDRRKDEWTEHNEENLAKARAAKTKAEGAR